MTPISYDTTLNSLIYTKTHTENMLSFLQKGNPTFFRRIGKIFLAHIPMNLAHISKNFYSNFNVKQMKQVTKLF
jgi:hypothetical protein